MSVGIELFGTDVVAVGVAPALGVVDHVVPVFIKPVPVVSIGSITDLVLRVLSRAPHRDHFALLDFRAALRSRDIRLAVARNDAGLVVAEGLNAETAILVIGMDGDVGRINLRLRLAVFEDRVIDDALTHLYLDLRPRKRGDVGLRVVAQPQDVGVIELHLGTRRIGRGNLVTADNGSIERGRRPVAGITSPRGDVTVNQTDAPHPRLNLHRRLRPGAAQAQQHHQ